MYVLCAYHRTNRIYSTVKDNQLKQDQKYVCGGDTELKFKAL